MPGHDGRSAPTNRGRVKPLLHDSLEKRAACDCKRPKSREETPKEGGGNARRYRTATTYTATHKWQGEAGQYDCHIGMGDRLSMQMRGCACERTAIGHRRPK